MIIEIRISRSLQNESRAVPIAMEPRGLLSALQCPIIVLQLCPERRHFDKSSDPQVPIGIFSDTLPYRDTLSRARIKVH